MHGEEWTEAEIERIRAGVAAKLSYVAIAAQLGRSDKAVCSKARRIGIRPRTQKRVTDKSLRHQIRIAQREMDQDSANSNAGQDQAFQAAMRKAIAAGLEFVEEGVSLAPCTDNPKFIRPSMPVCMRSSALICFEHGDTSRDIFA